MFCLSLGIAGAFFSRLSVAVWQSLKAKQLILLLSLTGTAELNQMLGSK